MNSQLTTQNKPPARNQESRDDLEFAQSKLYIKHLIGNQISLAAFLVLSLTVVGCSSTLLQADFENYDDGAPVGIDGIPPEPGAPLDGEPDGDWVIPEGPVCNGTTYSVSTDDAISGQKSLVLQYARLPHCIDDCRFCEELAVLNFDPVSPSDDGSPIRFLWNGRISDTLDDTKLEVAIREADEFFSKVRLLISQDRLEVFEGTTLEKIIFNDFGAVHSIFVRISPSDGSYGVQVAAPGLPIPPNNADPCVFPNVACGDFSTSNFDPSKLVMRMQFLGLPPSVSSTSQPEYRVDSINITQ